MFRPLNNLSDVVLGTIVSPSPKDLSLAVTPGAKAEEPYAAV